MASAADEDPLIIPLPRAAEPLVRLPKQSLPSGFSLDHDWHSACTPEARAARVNAPAHLAAATFQSFQSFADRKVPPAVTAWICGVLDGTERRGLVMHGPWGTGKTGLAVAALRALASEGFGSRFQWNVLCAGAPLAEDEIEEDEQDGLPATTPDPSPCWFASCSTLNAQLRRRRLSEKDWFSKLRDNVGALALDDVGVERATEFTENMLYDHLVWREERAGRILIMTTNIVKGEAWDLAFGRCADRLADVNQFVNVRMAGESLRPKREVDR